MDKRKISNLKIITKLLQNYLLIKIKIDIIFYLNIC